MASATPTPPPSPSASANGQPRTITERTETSTTYWLADGRTVTELHAGPIRVKQDDGSWADIDTDLIADGDGIRPKATKGDVSFSAGGSGAFARLRREGGESVELGWDGQLPKPDIDGNKAIYRGVAADGAGDLVATALPTGLRFDVVLNRRPTGPVEITVPVTGHGLTVAKAEGDRVAIKDGDKVIAASSTPALYDAASLHARQPGDKHQLRSASKDKAKVGQIDAAVTDTGGGKALVLKPSAEFLADPATVYPVTVDPSVVLPLNDDTDVNSAFDWNNVSGGYLKAGTEADGEKARAYLRFNTQGLKTPTKAVLKLSNLDAPACGTAVGAGIQVRRVTSHWDATAQTWTPQPSNTTEDAVTSTEGSQLGSCGSGAMSWDITPIVAKWAAGTANHGLVLQSPTETATTNYRVFASAENTDEVALPMLEVTSDEVITPGEGEDPADPGPADFKPGQVEPETGVWVTSAIDLDTDGLLTTRSHSAGQRIDLTLPNESVLGPHWRLEPLDGVLGTRLKDFSANGYIQVNHTSGTGSDRYEADPAKPGTYVAPEIGTVVKNADGTFTQARLDTGMTYTWTKVGTDILITKLGSDDTGMTVVAYDAQGRISGLAQPATPQDDCTVAGAAGCAFATYQYATATTATATMFADIAGQLKAITHAGPAATPVTAVTYAYDNLKRLRKVEDSRQLDGDPVKTWTYAYDSSGNITQLTTPSDGTWKLSYSAPGKLATATQSAPVMLRAAASSCPAPYASDYMLYGRCSTRVDVLKGSGTVWRTPFWKGTKTGGSVYGITNDGCSAPLIGDKPPTVPGLTFKPACDSHDYGYGLIRNKLNGMSNGLPRSKRTHVDAVFKTIMKTRICAAQNVSIYRERCNDWANIYYNAVRAKGDSAI
ncbi:phospholipase A2 (plasmid) [Streptosporangium sp. CA-135522]|uniref:phospholipase A2 n=1 Tax=Streptosporangium sp. CA-135522 TaxID=3240072 RepID=UPI003D8C5332